MPFQIIRRDITKLQTDAIVNAANSSLSMGGGVCGAIFSAAGIEELTAACDAIGRCPVGQAVFTHGFGLHARTVIHTAGPVWQGGRAGEAELLAGCYRNSLELALKLNLESVAFPLISSGVYGYPKAEALGIAIGAIRDFLESHDMTVFLVVFDKEAIRLAREDLEALEEYIGEHFQPPEAMVETLNKIEYSDAIDSMQYNVAYTQMTKTGSDLADVITLQDTFQECLLKKIDEKGMTDSEVYHKANLDRRLFSKIRCNKKYQPKKNTALALSIALELNIDETNDLLRKAGFALSPSRMQDMIVQYFIESKLYDIFQINCVLFDYGENLLGS